MCDVWCKLYVIFLQKFEFLGFWKILRNHLTGLQSGQATHVCILIFLDFCQKSPGGENCPPSDTNLPPSFLGFVWSIWRWWTPARRCEQNWLVLGLLWFFSRLFDRGKKGTYVVVKLWMAMIDELCLGSK